MTLHYNRTSQREKRRALRNNATPSARRLWARVRGKQLGARFRRQYSFAAFVVDFSAPSCRLAVEVDGDIHRTDDAIAADTERPDYLARFGIAVMRFTNAEVVGNLDAVVERIAAAVHERSQSPLAPPWEAGGRGSA